MSCAAYDGVDSCSGSTSQLTCARCGAVLWPAFMAYCDHSIWIARLTAGASDALVLKKPLHVVYPRQCCWCGEAAELDAPTRAYHETFRSGGTIGTRSLVMYKELPYRRPICRKHAEVLQGIRKAESGRIGALALGGTAAVVGAPAVFGILGGSANDARSVIVTVLLLALAISLGARAIKRWRNASNSQWHREMASLGVGISFSIPTASFVFSNRAVAERFLAANREIVEPQLTQSQWDLWRRNSAT
jgi:hypothetical protein